MRARKLSLVEARSDAAGEANEDRVGVAGALAWVIDGATDVLERKLTHAPTDAAWFAEAMHTALIAAAPVLGADLRDVPAWLAKELADKFQNEALRRPAGPEEYPSASAIIVRANTAGLEYVTLGDCAILAEADDGTLIHIGDDAEKAGDQWVVEAIKQQLAEAPSQNSVPARDILWPKLRRARALMNTIDGYGVFSIVAPPANFVRSGTLALRPGARVLLASDGLMRLVDVFRTHTHRSLFDDAWSSGLTSLVADLRAMEHADSMCIRAHRAKVHDDATGLLMRVE